MSALTHITTADLGGACREQVKLFERTFNGKAKITSHNLEKAIAVGLDVFWLERLIPESARAEYNKVTAPAWAEYNKATASALAEYNKAMASSRAEYNKAMASARAEYNKATAPALDEYNKVRGKALIVALTGGAA